MKPKLFQTILLLSLFILIGFANAAPLGTAFTYQGRLVDNNEVADGLYDFRFKLYDATSDGNQLNGSINIPDWDVIDGSFTVELDFGNEFNGDKRWLEVGVRPGDLNDPNVYMFLEPRQEITPVPYALQTRGMFVDDSGNVGIGTTNPVYNLRVRSSDGSSNQIRVTGDNADAYLMLERTGGAKLFSAAVGDKGIFGTDSNHSLVLRTWSAERMRIDTSGNVGIGTTSPSEELEVAGTVKATAFVGDGSGLTNLPVTPDTDWTILGNDMYSGVSGNVGIGIGAPNYPLHVSKDSNDCVGFFINTGTTAESHGLRVLTSGSDGTETAFNAGGWNGFNVRGSGKVIIGSSDIPSPTVPDMQLTVYNSGPPVASFISQANPEVVIETKSYEPTWGESANLIFSREGNYLWTMGSHPTSYDSHMFAITDPQASPGQIERFVIDADGNVGIGTADPGSAKLRISGGVLDVSSQRIMNVADPTSNQDAATKKYVDDNVGIPPLKTYDSGWFAVSKNNTYDKNHNLGTTKVVATLYFATSDTGEGMQIADSAQHDGVASNAFNLNSITTTTCKVDFYAKYYSLVNGSYTPCDNGYARIIMLALE